MQQGTGENREQSTGALKEGDPADSEIYALKDFLDWCPGVTGDIARYINSNLECDQPGIALATAIAFMSSVRAGRIQYGSIVSPTLYTCTVASSGSGKSRAQQIISEICLECGLKTLLMGRPASDAGILFRLQRAPRQFLIWDEFGLALEEMSKSSNSYRVSIISTIMDLYSASGRLHIGKEYVDKDRVDIESPYLSICAASTPGKFFNILTKDFIENGFLNRWLVFESPESDDYRDPIISDIPQNIIRDILAMDNGEPDNSGGALGGYIYKKRIEMILDPDTADIMKESRWDMLRQSKTDAHKTLWMRAKENAIKLCMTLSDVDGSCSDKTASYAWRLIKHLTNHIITRSDESIINKSQKASADRSKQFQELISKDEVLTQSQLTKRASNLGFSKREREERTDDMLESEQWVSESRTLPRSKKKTTYYALSSEQLLKHFRSLNTPN